MTGSEQTAKRLAAAMKTAKVIAGLRDEAQELAFAGAEHFLRQVVDLKDANKETFWRQVFADYLLVVARRGMRDCIEWQKIQSAALYADGENPRCYSIPKEACADSEAAPSERDFAAEDDEIPF
jgi:hypothetical protein